MFDIVVKYPTDQILDYEELAEIAHNKLPEATNLFLSVNLFLVQFYLNRTISMAKTGLD